MQYSSISMYCKRKELAPKEIANTVYAEMINVALSYMDNMGNARFNEMTMKPDAPFLGAGMGNGSVGICPTLEVTVFSAQAEEGKIATTMEALRTEMELHTALRLHPERVRACTERAAPQRRAQVHQPQRP